MEKVRAVLFCVNEFAILVGPDPNAPQGDLNKLSNQEYSVVSPIGHPKTGRRSIGSERTSF